MDYKEQLMEKIRNKTAIIGLVGLGYVGLPLLLSFAETGFSTMGFDNDPRKVKAINAGTNYFRHIGSDRVSKAQTASSPPPTTTHTIMISSNSVALWLSTPVAAIVLILAMLLRGE